MANNSFHIPEFRKRIYTLCKIHNLSLGLIAKRAGIPRSVLYNAINNNTAVSVKNLLKLSKTFGVSVDWLLGK